MAHSNRRLLLIVTAAVEVGAGAFLLLAPSLSGRLLFGNTGGTGPAGVARMGGAGLLALGVACWLMQNQPREATRGLLGGLLVYNAGAVAILGYAAIISGQRGIIAWPGVVLHAVLFFWCVSSLARDVKESAGAPT
jgi:hypothetical protein